MAMRCGIDLGTTYSAISWYDPHNNRVETVDLAMIADGMNIVRSVVYYAEGGASPVVGETAWNAAKQHPERVFIAIKRSMGTDYTRTIDGTTYTPQQVSSEILKALVAEAQAFFGEEVKDVVISVPAYFGDLERAATEDAGQLAGLNVLGILSEPSAAGLAFAAARMADIIGHYFMVFDLGGGTLDVTLIHVTSAPDENGVQKLKPETLCKQGDRELGGLDWDHALAELVAEKALQQHGMDVTADPTNKVILLENCEKAKRRLGQLNIVSCIPDLVPAHEVDVTLAEFEDRTRDLVERARLRLERALEEAENLDHVPESAPAGEKGVKRDMIEVLLAGGGTKMPMIRKMIEDVMGKPSLQHGNPELLVSMGAAYWAHLLQPDSTINVYQSTPGGDVATPVGLQEFPGEISCYAVGVKALESDSQGGWQEYNSEVVPNAAPFNQIYDKEFQTSEDGMTEIPIELYKGESRDLAQCESLLRFTITGLPPGRPKGQRVKVALGYDKNGILSGNAVDVATGKKVDIVWDRHKTSS